jgi:Response regulator consisting of a CheY-like receiver domain and a Fis-type HTH domain
MMTAKNERRLLIVEDDAAFARTLVRSFERRGYQVRHLAGEEGMAALLDEFAPTHAVVDLKLASGASGLSSVRRLYDADPEMVIVVLTGGAVVGRTASVGAVFGVELATVTVEPDAGTTCPVKSRVTVAPTAIGPVIVQV